MKTIRQTAVIRGATPHDLYETIMDSKQHTKLSRQATTVSRHVDGAFKVGHWDKGVYSRATFSFAKAPAGTRITFVQTPGDRRRPTAPAC